MSRFQLLLCLFLAPAVGATTVYKTVDERGRVSFSDQPPAQETELVEVLHYDATAPNPSALDIARIEAMREVTDRMAADRRERESRRTEARRQSDANRWPAYSSADYQDVSGSSYYDGSYYGGGYYDGGYPAYRRPRHGVRPPLGHRPKRPSMAVSGAPRSYPASLVRRHYTSTARDVFYRRGQ